MCQQRNEAITLLCLVVAQKAAVSLLLGPHSHAILLLEEFVSVKTLFSKNLQHTRIGIFTALTVTPSDSCKNRHIGGTYRFGC
jgi:hypothetical protein